MLKWEDTDELQKQLFLERAEYSDALENTELRRSLLTIMDNLFSFRTDQ